MHLLINHRRRLTKQAVKIYSFNGDYIQLGISREGEIFPLHRFCNVLKLVRLHQPKKSNGIISLQGQLHFIVCVVLFISRSVLKGQPCYYDL